MSRTFWENAIDSFTKLKEELTKGDFSTGNPLSEEDTKRYRDFIYDKLRPVCDKAGSQFHDLLNKGRIPLEFVNQNEFFKDLPEAPFNTSCQDGDSFVVFYAEYWVCVLAQGVNNNIPTFNLISMNPKWAIIYPPAAYVGENPQTGDTLSQMSWAAMFNTAHDAYFKYDKEFLIDVCEISIHACYVLNSPEITSPLINVPLPSRPKLIYEKLISLQEHEAMTGPEILDWLSKKHGINIDEGTLRNTYLKPLKPYGLVNTPRVGYYIRRPKA